MPTWNRRGRAALALTMPLAFAACRAGGPWPGPATPPPLIPTTMPLLAPPTMTMAVGGTPSSGELDLRNANVVDVSFESLGENLYRFDVTLYHDDEGEAPQYADAWQVEDLDGNVLAVRELLHAHGTQPFTRSMTFELPPSIDQVVVRGHDMRHGFGGQAVRVDVRSGELASFQSPAGN